MVAGDFGEQQGVASQYANEIEKRHIEPLVNNRV